MDRIGLDVQQTFFRQMPVITQQIVRFAQICPPVFVRGTSLQLLRLCPVESLS